MVVIVVVTGIPLGLVVLAGFRPAATLRLPEEARRGKGHEQQAYQQHKGTISHLEPSLENGMGRFVRGPWVRRSLR
jgi:hypothetical protein